MKHTGRFIIVILIWMIGTSYALLQQPVDVVPVGAPVVDSASSRVSQDLLIKRNGVTVFDVNASNFSISEPARDLIITAEDSIPLNLSIIVDMSFGSSQEIIKDTLRSYITHYYRAGDTLNFYILDNQNRNSTPRVVAIESAEQAQSVIDALVTSTRFFTLSNTLTQVYENLVANPPTEGQSQQILLVGSYLNDPTEVDGSRRFLDISVPFHTVQAHTGRPITNYRTLANNGGGLFANNDGGAAVLGDANYEPINTLKVLFDTIASKRILYNLSYLATDADLNPVRNVTVTVTLAGGDSGTASYSYERVFLPPEVAFSNPAQLTPQRRPFRDDNQAVQFDIDEQPITVAVTFPDGINRDLASLRLEVIEADSASVLHSSLILEPESNENGTYTLNWDLTRFTTSDDVIDVLVSVTAVDELDLIGSISESGLVTVGTIPPLPTNTPEPTATITLTPTEIPPTATEVAVVVAPVNPTTTDGEGVSNAPFDDPTTRSLMGIVILLMVTLIIALMLLARFRRQPAVVASAPVKKEKAPATEEDTPEEYITDAGQDQAETPEAPPDGLYARIFVKQGVDEIGERQILVHDREYTIGRKPGEDIDLVIDQPYISPKHCKIIVNNGQFMVHDYASKNGTFVNGERIPADRDMPVPLGSEIGVTRNIILEVWDSKAIVTFDEGMESELTGPRTRTSIEDVKFKALPGLRYQPDDGEPVNDEYSPI